MKNWKTSLIGLGIGMIQIVPQVLAGASANGKVNWAQFGMGLGSIALGYFAKDFDKTGVGR